MMMINRAIILFFIAGVSQASQAFVTQPYVSPSSFTSQSTTNTAIRMSSGGSSLPVTELKPPVAIYEGAVAAGTAKGLSTAAKIFKLGIVAGIHISFGAYLMISVGGNVPGIASSNPGVQKFLAGAMGLPTGLIMTLVSGAELFTGNTALVTSAYMENKIKLKDLLKNWFWSFTGNFVGSIFMAYLVFGSGTLGVAPGAVNTAIAKCSATWLQTFYRGILCNFLVCMAVYMASGCSSMIGKMTAVWFPISAFIALGLDHSVANMFILPLGILRGADITIAQMFTKNLIPTTLGNIVGGALMVMMPFGLTIGNWADKNKK